MIKVIIFDFGGVVVTEIMPLVYVKISELVNKSPDEVKKLIKHDLERLQKGEFKSDEFWKRSSTKLNIAEDKLKRTWLNTFEKNTVFLEGTREIVNKLKNKNYRLVLLSNSTEMHAEINRRKNLYQNFSPIILSFQLGTIKPEEKIYKLAIKELGVGAEECVFIDNKEVNLVTAKKLGMKTILFKSPEQLEKDLEKVL